VALGSQSVGYPIRFVFRNKLTKDDRMLLAFDALVLSQVLGRAVSLGKIIHGDDHATLEVKTSALSGEVRKRTEKIAALLSSHAPPDLVLNRHCAECEFQARCRKIAVEKDDLSLLAGMLFYGLARGFSDANVMPILCQIVGGKYRATGYGFLNLFSTFAGGAMIYAGGLLRDANVSLMRVFQASAIGLVIAGLILLAVRPSRCQEER
jgi:hypothetical protein